MTKTTALALAGAKTIAWNASLHEGLTPIEVVFGHDDTGVGEVQIAIASASSRPTKGAMDAAWKTRGINTAMPVIVAAAHRDGVWIYDGKTLPRGPYSVAQAERQLQSVLDERDVLAAQQRIVAIERAFATDGAAGYSNHFLFASYHLRVNVPRRPDWATAQDAARPMLIAQGKTLITALGFTSEPVSSASNAALVLRAASGSRRAIAVLLDESENFDQKSPAYQLSPVAHGLEVAGREEVPWLIVLRQSTLRLYPGRDGVGVGQRGQSETYFELDLSLLDPDLAGLLPLIFSAAALEKGGSADEILDGSGRYAAELGADLRDRVYERVVPPLAVAISQRLPDLGVAVDGEGLKVAYALTLRILFRILFQAYGEDSELLPAGRNENYDANSLQAFVKRSMTTDAADFSPSASSIWLDLVQVWDAIFNGNPQWEVPAYGGSLFDPATHEGRLLKKLELPDSVLGPALQAMLTEVTEDGTPGAVDFRSLQVREFGTIYEGLLESSLSLAESDLSLDARGSYVPAKEGDEIAAHSGTPYFHSASGERKATGSYFTPKIVVDHLIERSVEPALAAHLQKVQELVDSGKERRAASLFWDFRVGDLAMGSAHFLVAAVDKIERGMRDFLTITDMPTVRAELARLASKAREALGADVEAAEMITEAQLLRRQIARRCIYGLDINPLAVELSRLALWIHTFVPGLPMSSLDHGLVLGNSLTGIGTIQEALDALGVGILLEPLIREPLDSARALLIDFANASEADRGEVAQGAELLHRAIEASRSAKDIFDAVVAMRLGLAPAGSAFTQADIDAIVGAPGAREAIRALAPSHLPFLFPEVFLRERAGFDVLVGNPPWDKVRWEAAPYWSKISPGLMALPDLVRNARIEQLRLERPTEAARERAEVIERERLQEYFRAVFTLRGGTHLEMAQLMLERAVRSVRATGYVGVVLPRQALVLAGWKRLREYVFNNHEASLVQARNGGGWLFEGVHASYAVVLLSVGPESDKPVGVAVVSSAAELGALVSKSYLFVARSELSSYSDSMVVPWFGSAADRVVFDKMRQYPRLSSGHGWVQGTHDARWDFRGSGPDRALVVTSTEPAAWSVMMTRHVDALALRDTAVKQFIVDFSALVGKSRAVDFDRSGQPRFTSAHPVIIFRHPSRSDDTRTLIASALPDEGYIYNKGYVHAIAHTKGTSSIELLALLGLLSTNTEDWWARRFVDRHVTAPVINNLPVPALEASAIESLARRTAVLLLRSGYEHLAGGIDVGAIARESAYLDEPRDELLSAMEATVAHGFGLSGLDLKLIQRDFSARGMPGVIVSRASALLDGRQGTP